jgi:hypothetical protein
VERDFYDGIRSLQQGLTFLAFRVCDECAIGSLDVFLESRIGEWERAEDGKSGSAVDVLGHRSLLRGGERCSEGF